MGKIVDLSYFQGDIDFAKLSKEIDLAIIRVQYGSTKIDSRYKEYVKGCKAHNIPFGHYAYARFLNLADAKVEAKDFLARADKDAEFLVVDVEEMTTNRAIDLVPSTQAFIDYLHQHGAKKVGLYTGHSFYSTYKMNKVKADFLWIPRYPSNDNGQPNGPKPTMKTDLWQYSQRGKVSGISGYVDLNQLAGGKPLSYFTGKDTNKVSKSVEKVSSTKKSTTSTASSSTYIVKLGDTLSELAIKYKTTVANLKKLNGLKTDVIKVGQKLKVPTVASTKKYHTVVSGETISGIAAKHKLTLTKIKSLNPSIKNFNKISVGQKIRVK